MKCRIIIILSFCLLFLSALTRVKDIFPNEKIIEIPAVKKERGKIYDFKHHLLAESIPVKSVVISTRGFFATSENIDKLSKILHKSPEKIRLLLTQKESVFVKEEIPPSIANEINNIPGVLTFDCFKRLYIFKDSTANILGNLSQDGQGLSGIEAFYNNLLRFPDTSIRTSIDIEIQQNLYKNLVRTLRIFRAKDGGAIILELSTGRLVSLVSYSLLNPIITDSLSLSMLERPFKQAFHSSSYDNLATFLRDLGFGELTRIDLPGEKIGILPTEVDDFSDVFATPLQMVRALAALATGKLYYPKLVWEIETPRKTYFIGVKSRNLSKIKKFSKGGYWWWGGNKKAGVFLLAGLWPRRSPRLAYILYVKGVRVRGLPVHPSRLVPGALLSYRLPYKKMAKTGSLSQKIMPDVRGLTLKAALQRLSGLGIEVQFSGFGVTVKQWPPPGTPLKKIKKCRLILDENA